MCAAKTGELEDTVAFVGPMDAAGTVSAFDALDASKTPGIRALTYQSKAGEAALAKYQANAGYQPYERVKGYIDGSSRTTRPGSILNVQRAGVYGQCSDAGALNFMRPSERSTCGFIPKALDSAFCEGLSLEGLFNMKIYKTADTNGETIGITVGEVKKYSYDSENNDYKEITLAEAAITALKGKKGKPDYSESGASVGPRAKTCDGFVLEYRLRIKYTPITTQSTAAFTIDEATLDLVYGTMAVSNNEEQKIARVSSVSYYQTAESRVSSGTPGYLKQYPIRTASKVIRDTGKDEMAELKDGMYLRGADNSGECIQLTLGAGETYETKIKNFVPEYTEDPLLTFEDSILYGCHLDLDFNGLRDFCNTKGYEKLLLFQYLNQSLSHIGKFGNSNPHFVSDWVEVFKEADENAAGQFQDDSGVCQAMSPSLLVSIYYQKIGRVEEHQHEIVNATLRWSN